MGSMCSVWDNSEECYDMFEMHAVTRASLAPRKLVAMSSLALGFRDFSLLWEAHCLVCLQQLF